MTKQDFIKAGFTVVGTENNENKLLSFLKENYPNVIRDNEVNIEELKTVLGLPIDEKVNGYGLNFVGRNFARAKYAQKTEKELRLNRSLSVAEMTTQNLLLKGDNLDSLKILKNHYSGKIKCIYIDPPYNTTNDEFVYPDKFDKEEAEVLGFANLSESDFARMDFSFKTKKSHNGWLAFMYPRLLLARDLLSKEGAIFISIDDNEQANLKLLCDDVFGEENFVAEFVWSTKKAAQGMNTQNMIVANHEYILVYSKSRENFKFLGLKRLEDTFSNPDNDTRGLWKRQYLQRLGQGLPVRKIVDPKTKKEYSFETPYAQKKLEQWIIENRILFPKNGVGYPARKEFLNEYENNQQLVTNLGLFPTKSTTEKLYHLFDGHKIFTNPKPDSLLKFLLEVTMNTPDSIILDFFAGSGTTGHAVMQLNAEDGGNRKFILCQIDEPINKDKPAYKFCKDNKLPPVISSITIERLKRAGEGLNQDFIKKQQDEQDLFNQGNQANSKNQGSDNNPENLDKIKVKTLDIGFKVFDSVEAPKLKVDETGQISITKNETDALSRIYNMIFTVGLDEPTQVPEEVVKDCIYKIGNNYYLSNSEKIKKDEYSNLFKNIRNENNQGKVFIDGWTASLNGTLQNYKEDVKIVF
ncbi:MAG: site-specific DNA-methyltransferase [Limnohabitans sp.]|nr:site-specific DNA-methyltransferase [Limnohabitans sp.]